MKSNALSKLNSLGQSLWLESWSRNLMYSGELERMIREDGLKGASFSLSSFEKAMDENPDYDETVRILAAQGRSVEEIYQILLVADVRAACETLRPVYQKTKGQEGFVSFDLSPYLAQDPQALAAEARELWAAVGRVNAMVKIPATAQGVEALRILLQEGIPVQATHLYSLSRYRKVAEACLAALEARQAAGQSLQNLPSSAGFSLSRMDAQVDGLLDKKLERGQQVRLVHRLVGQAAIAHAKIAYQIYKTLFQGARFQALAQQGAQPQRLMWTHTSSGEPGDNDVKYAESLIGPDTVLCLSLKTARAFKDHGAISLSLEDRLEQADQTLDGLLEAGIDPEALASQLEQEALQKLKKPYDTLLGKIRQFLVAA